ncbi:hypothetical protein HJC23_009028 [Cyclotella cryptica]|uniref:Uncharacterized protein n=1 Tax=Cyclotella cryptica TaxID=29204 RepID=A0ABD3QZY8_9STRA|eukprot:CCRYP_000627-RA/>CCRYP_000627-RA protein AED:0.48 eAED:0.48 QI:0/-1/0/1/-1/1/1/0/178
MNNYNSIVSILLLLTSFLLVSVSGQFGIPKTVPISLSQQNGEEMMDVSQGSGSGKQGFLSDQDAADMEAIINEAKKDVETMAMITKMKSENKEHIAELQTLSPAEILGGMKETLDNMKLIEYLFQDKQRAVREMEKEGMIDKAHIKKYRKDPDLLEQDTRRGLYFQFISLAVVGGFME